MHSQQHRIQVIAGLLSLGAIAPQLLAPPPPPPPPVPAWINTGGGNVRGFAPNASDFYQHQKWGLTPIPPATGSPPGQSAAAWENSGGICHLTSYTNAFYRLFREGSCMMFGNGTTITNQNWLGVINASLENMGSFVGGFNGVQRWLNDHDDAGATCPRPLKYDLFVRYPDATLPYYPPPPYGGPGQPPVPPEPIPVAGWVDGAWYYDGPGARWEKAPAAFTAFDQIVKSMKENSTVLVRLRTLPWVPAGCVAGSATPDPKFDSSLWWRGNGGNQNIVVGACTVQARGGYFHEVCIAGVNKDDRKLYFSDPDSNKGNFKQQAGINWGNKPDAPVTARKYHPWIPELGGGDAIPVPWRDGNNDPPFFTPYYMTVELCADLNTFCPGVDANERYKNVTMSWVEIIATEDFRKTYPVIPLQGDPLLNHTFEVGPGQYANADEFWFLPPNDIQIDIDSIQMFGSMAGWDIQLVGPPSVPGDPNPIMQDPWGNALTARGLLFSRCETCPAMLAGEISTVKFNTTAPWEGDLYKAFTRNPNSDGALLGGDPQLAYKVQVKGVPEPLQPFQIRGGLDDSSGLARNCPFDFNGDGIVDKRDLLIAMNDNATGILNVLQSWGACK